MKLSQKTSTAITAIKQVIRQVQYVYLMWRIKRRADAYQRNTGKQHYVVKYNGALSIMSRAWFKDARQRGMFPLHYTVSDLKRDAYYTSQP